MLVRELCPEDHDAALTLNNAAAPAVNPHTPESWRDLLAMADRSWVVEDAGVLCGLLVTFGPGSAYESSNYRWIDERYGEYRYVDRIIIAPSHKRRGLGLELYGILERHAELVNASRLLCEVNVEPPNPQSIDFHLSSGWRPVEDRRHGPGKVVRYFERAVGTE
jgi:uncharacterized protein